MTTRILVVEDEALLAFDLAIQLASAGFEVVGPVASVAQALAIIHQVGCDAAVLDFHLGNETSEPVASELVARGTPFVTVSAHLHNQQPGVFSGAPALSKPIRIKILLAELRRCLLPAHVD